MIRIVNLWSRRMDPFSFHGSFYYSPISSFSLSKYGNDIIPNTKKSKNELPWVKQNSQNGAAMEADCSHWYSSTIFEVK